MVYFRKGVFVILLFIFSLQAGFAEEGSLAEKDTKENSFDPVKDIDGVIGQYYFTGEIDSGKYEQFHGCDLNKREKTKFYMFDYKIFAECAGAYSWIPMSIKNGKYEFQTNDGIALSLLVQDGKVINLVFDKNLFKNQKPLIKNRDSCLIAAFFSKYKVAYKKNDYEQYTLGFGSKLYKKYHNDFKKMAFTYHDPSLKESDILFRFFFINIVHYAGEKFVTYHYSSAIDDQPVIEVNASEFCLRKFNDDEQKLLTVNCNDPHIEKKLFLKSRNCVLEYLNN